MKNKLLLCAVGALLLCPLRAARGQGTAFTYQGHLKENAAPVDGPYDFRFGVFNSDSGGIQLGSFLEVPDLAVTKGLFTTKLDFGGGIFSGEPRWLQIEVRPGISSSDFTLLTPRQEINPTPYAIFAGNAALLNDKSSQSFLLKSDLLTDSLEGPMIAAPAGGIKFPNGTVQTSAADLTGNDQHTTLRARELVLNVAPGAQMPGVKLCSTSPLLIWSWYFSTTGVGPGDEVKLKNLEIDGGSKLLSSPSTTGISTKSLAPMAVRPSTNPPIPELVIASGVDTNRELYALGVAQAIEAAEAEAAAAALAASQAKAAASAAASAASKAQAYAQAASLATSKAQAAALAAGQAAAKAFAAAAATARAQADAEAAAEASARAEAAAAAAGLAISQALSYAGAAVSASAQGSSYAIAHATASQSKSGTAASASAAASSQASAAASAVAVAQAQAVAAAAAAAAAAAQAAAQAAAAAGASAAAAAAAHAATLAQAAATAAADAAAAAAAQAVAVAAAIADATAAATAALEVITEAEALAAAAALAQARAFLLTKPLGVLDCARLTFNTVGDGAKITIHLIVETAQSGLVTLTGL